MQQDNIPWWGHVIAATVIASLFAAVPFWTHGLTLMGATICAGIIFPAVVVLYTYVVWRETRRR
jgi:hypothetical protein